MYHSGRNRKDGVSQLQVRSRKVRTALIATFSVAFLASLATPSDAGNVIVVGWDAAGLRHVQPMLSRGELPNLAAFLQSGGHMVPLELIARTSTIASWTEVFTGLTYDQTGVLGNNKNGKSGGQLSNKTTQGVLLPGFNFWIRVIPFNDTIIPAIQQQGYRVGWFVSKIYLDNDKNHTPLAFIAKNAAAFLLKDPKFAGDGYLPQLEDATESFATSNSQFFIFEHLDPDYYGHIFGDQSARFEQEIVRCDTALGELMTKIDRTETKIVVISDHGFDPGAKEHLNAPDAFMATDLPVDAAYYQQPNQRAFATPRDVATMLLQYFGVAWQSRSPQMRGKPLLD